jgi:CO dehydrogenase nickel-insertion accessory protein CooC1
LWSKEYIHGPGGRVIATEERLTFSDVVDGSPYYEDIYRIAARGVTVGCGGGNFCPDGQVTRAQMAVFIERALGVFTPPTPTMQHFTDVPPSYWAYDNIEDFATRGITSGCTSTTYCPEGPVLQEQMAKFIIKARGEPDPPWPTQQRFNDVPISGQNQNQFANFIDRMAFLEIWPGCGSGNYCPASPLTRRQMAHILVRAFGI